MKIITLNTHSLEEENYEEKLHQFVEGIFQEKPDVIALQEVNQTRTADPVPAGLLEQCGFIRCEPGMGGADCEEAVIRVDNHSYRAARMLRERGICYTWTWTAAKVGYDKYDEGLAVFSRFPVLDTRQFFITGTHDYNNWKTRKILGIQAETGQGPMEFYSVHMGWWEDEEEPFETQWKRINSLLKNGKCMTTWLMGDFNSPASVSGQGYDLVKRSGWLDTYELAAEKDDGITVDHSIDGWKERKNDPGMRIDYIWTGKKQQVMCSRVLFNGKNYPVVSDHYGVLAVIGAAADGREG
ncbi:exodeoxyribonuclease III [Clostridium sp. MCC353]|uniref:endonuclease/exonuclease/phosphatase family protein n=1 Tax=Clostridium sp. MCC353 TaxID=2592646 RepID=UPI001C01A920|nr:endonuclease/exonuclease/phosphatase family protein [Clostridium sp. MCC353]MBT9775197.1 exodeoxyribonuclease III [Clostridium sp. MCC353]